MGDTQPLDERETSRKWKLAKAILRTATALYLWLQVSASILLVLAKLPPAVYQNISLWGFASWSGTVIGVGTGYGFANVLQHGVYQFAGVWKPPEK